MKKFIVFAVIIALIAAAPWFVGLQAQKQVESQVHKANEYPGSKIELTEYNRGLINSSAKVRISYEVSASPDADEGEKKFIELMQEGLVLNFDITHGPVLTKPDLGTGLSHTIITIDDSQAFIRDAEKLFGVEELMVIEANLGLGGAGSGTMNIPELAFEEENKSFRFGGAHIDFDLSEFGKKYSSQGSLQPLTVNAENQQVSTSAITISGEGEQNDSLYGTGSFNLKMANLTASGEKSFNLENFSLGAAVGSPEAGKMDINYKLALDKLEGSDMPKTLNNTVLDLTLNNLRESAITQFSELGAQADMADPAAMGEYQQKMMNAMTDLLSGSPVIEINKFAFEFGDDSWMNLQGKLAIDGEIAGKPEAQGNPFMMIPAIDANYTANMSESIVKLGVQQYLAQQAAAAGMSAEEMEQMNANQEQQTSMMIGQFVGMGFLQKTEEGYRVEASFKDSELLVNGNPIPLPI